MLNSGDEIELIIEKPAAGGRMLARHDGQVVFVTGAIPGERVRARIERVERQLAFAAATAIVEPSADRRDPAADPACGGLSYSHVAYVRQLELKSQLIRDAFTRLGRIPLTDAVDVRPSPERGYRMRARFHMRAGRVGFYREGSHDLCDARGTHQLLEESVDAATEAILAAAALSPVAAATLSENVAADQRALHFEGVPGQAVEQRALEAAMRAGRLTGCAATSNGRQTIAGNPVVTDPLPMVTAGRAGSGVLQRHAESFFQANRYLLPQLVGTVLDAVPAEGQVMDLYAGVGLFAVSLAQSGRERIIAVEGDRASAKDLAANASACGASLHVVAGSVERFLASHPRPAETIIVDPPRSGISRAAMEAVVRGRASRVIYVSCDPPTMARDARRLLDGGYRMGWLRAFDLYPNTPHVECVAIFDRGSAA